MEECTKCKLMIYFPISKSFRIFCEVPTHFTYSSLKNHSRSQSESVSDTFQSHLDIGMTELEMCQCCLSAKNLKNITRSYNHCGRDEVYSRMLSFAFIDVNIYYSSNICYRIKIFIISYFS